MINSLREQTASFEIPFTPTPTTNQSSETMKHKLLLILTVTKAPVAEAPYSKSCQSRRRGRDERLGSADGASGAVRCS